MAEAETPVLTLEVVKVEVEDMAELNIIVMVEVELLVLLFRLSPLASEPLPPASVF